jgi:hypothetical protein
LSPDQQEVVQEQVRIAAAPFATRRGYDFPGLCLNALTS